MKNHGGYPFGNAKARALVWNFPDPIPQHREPIYGTRPDLVAKYPTHDDLKSFWRMPTLYTSLQQKNVADKLYEKFPIILTRSEEHTSKLQSLMRISYAVFCLKKKTSQKQNNNTDKQIQQNTTVYDK